MAMDRVTGRSLAARLFGPSPARTLALLQAAWPLAVGSELARRTEVVGIEGAMLRVRVPDASWRKGLHRVQPQILRRLREVAGDLAPRRLGFLAGAISAAPAAPPPPAAPALSSAASAIPDAEIRSRFLEAASRYLARAGDAGRDRVVVDEPADA